MRSSSTDSPAKAAWRHGKELGEHSLLDMDCIPLTEEEEDGDLGSTVSPDLPTDLPPLVQSPFDKERDGKNQELPQQDIAGHRLLESKSFILNEIIVTAVRCEDANLNSIQQSGGRKCTRSCTCPVVFCVSSFCLVLN